MPVDRDELLYVDRADNVESAGQYPPEDLVPEAIKILRQKIQAVEDGLDRLFENSGTAQ